MPNKILYGVPLSEISFCILTEVFLMNVGAWFESLIWKELYVHKALFKYNTEMARSSF